MDVNPRVSIPLTRATVSLSYVEQIDTAGVWVRLCADEDKRSEV